MNYRMTELVGAVGLGQLSKLDKILKIRRTTGGLLTELISDAPGVNVPFHYDGVVHSYWIYTFTIDEERLGVNCRL